MNLRLLQIGKTREAWLRKVVEEYRVRISPYASLELVELPDVSLKQTGNIEVLKFRETALCLKRIAPDDYVVLLDERGSIKSSLEFSAFLTKLSDRKRIVFVIGGVYGVTDKMKERADYVLSLSRLTFTHQMVRLVLIEQLYRALMIANNRSYHY